jgi:hypothetical protein
MTKSIYKELEDLVNKNTPEQLAKMCLKLQQDKIALQKELLECNKEDVYFKCPHVLREVDLNDH